MNEINLEREHDSRDADSHSHVGCATEALAETLTPRGGDSVDKDDPLGGRKASEFIGKEHQAPGAATTTA